MRPVSDRPRIPYPANHQVAPVAEQPTSYDPTYNPEYNPNQLPDDGCWTTQCLDMPQPTGKRAYCPQCQPGIDGLSFKGSQHRTNNNRRCIDP